MRLEFEQPLVEIDERIKELEKKQKANELAVVKEERQQLYEQIYSNLEPWDRVQIARLGQRPTTLDYIYAIFDDFIELHGDRTYGDDAAMVGGLAMFNGKPVTVIGHQRGKDTKDNIHRNFGMAHPEGYRKALRLMKQADKFRRPVICFIDTKGAYPGKAAEERGQSESIARNLVEMAGLSVPVISIVIGEGGSGGALGIGICNHLLMLENSTYSVISPEGAAALLWKDSTQAKRAAESMKITAPDLLELGVADEVIKEVMGGAHQDVQKQSEWIAEAVNRSLEQLSALSPVEIVNQRYEKYRHIGSGQ
ncbi:acetyl-CoA carboxylase carboxyltransferase subunit alpha [Macrococcus hajekii]|uniref:Acetyl-coenzyme A carboxylase carboxyl transferase subunit alpha n=1 Tax=Macrococcus hajekii TaxID=198482 RepID=A0A4R6BLP3_9STAP|nr:acetyl-CoA carboxylase carboxyltransferase subunit alpha [Macrococcus hajekii]TDM02706.1 acetyl-CoA carboxylase carboxyltransferase subunit alpha [Macrococcus hajekii]GGB03217.1 acetyl-coenzyme A carboxylase carboxyl transferase subunit alpha [Macrococcus hajekii]